MEKNLKWNASLLVVSSLFVFIAYYFLRDSLSFYRSFFGGFIYSIEYGLAYQHVSKNQKYLFLHNGVPALLILFFLSLVFHNF
jgi:hypothetical protein